MDGKMINCFTPPEIAMFYLNGWINSSKDNSSVIIEHAELIRNACSILGAYHCSIPNNKILGLNSVMGKVINLGVVEQIELDPNPVQSSS